MITFSFYDEVTGVFNGTLFTVSDANAIALNTPEGHKAIVGHYDHKRRRVDIETGEVVDYQPPSPSTDHEWDSGSKEWRLNAVAANKLLRQSVARWRIKQLVESQHHLVRQGLLSMIATGITPVDVRKQLFDIDDEINKLREVL